MYKKETPLFIPLVFKVLKNMWLIILILYEFTYPKSPDLLVDKSVVYRSFYFRSPLNTDEL